MGMLMLQYNFGLRSCFHREVADVVLSFGVGILAQLLCAYVTLPLYALVTQVQKLRINLPITSVCSSSESFLVRWVPR